MEKTKIKEFVENWMKGHEEDTFVKNEHGQYIYWAGSSGLNIKLFFEDLIEDFIEEQNELFNNPQIIK